MSSLHHDHLLVEGPVLVPSTGSTPVAARRSTRKPVEEKATIEVRKPRQGKSRRTGPTQTTGGTAPASRPRRATAGKTGASAKAATAKSVTARAAAKTTAPATARAKATAPAKATSAKRTADAVPASSRPTPYKRAAEALEVPAERVEDAAPAVEVEDAAPAVEVEATGLVSPVAGGLRFLRRRPLGRRPGLYLAAAVVAAVSVSGFSAGDSAAQATSTASHSVSVAEELGIETAAAEEITAIDATQRLGELAVSRNVRADAQAAAAQVQATADEAATAAAAAAAAAAAEAARPKAVLPVSGARLTSQFGARWGTLHAGIDLAAPMQTPEYAAMDGVVLEAGPASGFGLAVYIQHENGDVTVYGHMDSILVQAGQVVRAGETIALLGNRGQSTGPHLHFEVHVGGINGQKIDPLPWLRERGVAI